MERGGGNDARVVRRHLVSCRAEEKTAMKRGDAVEVISPHGGRKGARGVIAIVDGPAYGVRFKGSRKVHKWYTQSELRKVDARETAQENPASSGVICMGRQVEIDLREAPVGRSSGGKTIVPPPDAGLLHDESGDYWPKCSLLIADFERGDEQTDEGESYFGRGATITRGYAEAPPDDLSAWQRLGEIKTIFYDRAGTKHPGFFRHEFNKPRDLWRLVFLIKGKAAKQPAVLYTHYSRRLGQTFYRVELPDGCIVNDRGIVLP